MAGPRFVVNMCALREIFGWPFWGQAGIMTCVRRQVRRDEPKVCSVVKSLVYLELGRCRS